MEDRADGNRDESRAVSDPGRQSGPDRRVVKRRRWLGWV